MTAPSLALYAGIFVVGLLSLAGTAWLAFRGVAWCVRSLARYLRERAMRRVLADRMADAASRYSADESARRARLDVLYERRIKPAIDAEKREAAREPECSECGARLLFSARARGNGRCGPCTRAEDTGGHCETCGRELHPDDNITGRWCDPECAEGGPAERARLRDEQRSVDELREALRVQREPRDLCYGRGATGPGSCGFRAKQPGGLCEMHEAEGADYHWTNHAIWLVQNDQPYYVGTTSGGYVATTSTDATWGPSGTIYTAGSSGTTCTTLEGSSHGMQVVSGVSLDTVTDGTCSPLQFDSDGPVNVATNRPAPRTHRFGWTLVGVQGCLCAVEPVRVGPCAAVEVYQPEAKAWVPAHYSLADAARQVLRDATS